jgi:hypothetical protein
MGFPLAVGLVVVLGSLLVLWARSDREATSAPRVGDHWHSAYDVYVCDDFRSKIVVETDPNGIHTHSDGLIHIHPFNNDDSVVLDTGEALLAGADCNGQPAVVKVARFDADDMERDPEVLTEDLANVRFLKDREAFTIALVPADVEPPAPRPERLTFLDVVNPRALTSDPLAPAPTTGG